MKRFFKKTFAILLIFQILISSYPSQGQAVTLAPVMPGANLLKNMRPFAASFLTKAGGRFGSTTAATKAGEAWWSRLSAGTRTALTNSWTARTVGAVGSVAGWAGVVIAADAAHEALTTANDMLTASTENAMIERNTPDLADATEQQLATEGTYFAIISGGIYLAHVGSVKTIYIVSATTSKPYSLSVKSRDFSGRPNMYYYSYQDLATGAIYTSSSGVGAPGDWYTSGTWDGYNTNTGKIGNITYPGGAVAIPTGDVSISVPDVPDTATDDEIRSRTGDVVANPGAVLGTDTPPVTGGGTGSADLPFFGDAFAKLWEWLQKLWDGILAIPASIAAIYDYLTNPTVDTTQVQINWYPLLASSVDFQHKFPFSIPWDLLNKLKEFDVTPKAPKFHIEKKPLFTVNGVEFNADIPVDLTVLDPFATIVRWSVTFIVDFGALFLFRRMTQD